MQLRNIVDGTYKVGSFPPGHALQTILPYGGIAVGSAPPALAVEPVLTSLATMCSQKTKNKKQQTTNKGGPTWYSGVLARKAHLPTRGVGKPLAGVAPIPLRVGLSASLAPRTRCVPVVHLHRIASRWHSLGLVAAKIVLPAGRTTWPAVPSGSHAKHSIPNGEYVVPIHGSHSLRSAFGIVPGGHDSHPNLSALAILPFPAGHASQLSPCGDCVPRAQGVQLDLSSFGDLPAKHFTHCD
eukprot:SAG11_NODE_5127_length_1657_cov_1.477535_1_plen_240_part_00